MKRLNKLLFILYPFRDALGINVGSTPFRIGEIYSVVYAICALRLKKTFRFREIDRRVRNIIVLLILNFCLTALVSYANINYIDTDFFVKYLVRNGLTIFLLVSVIGTLINYSPRLIVYGIKWNIILQIVFAIIFFVLSKRMFMNHVSSIWDFQTANYGQLELPRFAGTSSEAGFLGPGLAVPLFYFISNYKKELKWLVCCLVLLLVTFSTSNYFIIIITLATILYKKNKRNFFKLVLEFLVSFSLIVGIVMLFFRDSILSMVIISNFEKFIGYITLGSYGTLDWSASDRTEHLGAALQMFFNGNILQVLFGHGTGAYSFSALHNTNLMVQTVEEAYNIYLSTLTDRGIIGLLIFILIFYNIYKLKTNNPFSDALWFGLAIQLVHFIIVGNLWVYYVWQEVLFLIGYEKYLKIKGNEAQNN